MEALTGRVIDWAVAERGLPGHGESGDRYLVKHLPQRVLVAVVDGLGHGAEAAAAARIAIHTLERYAESSVISLVRSCHESLAGTRGVVVSVASFSAREGTMTWVGVGNVEGVLLRAHPAARPRREILLLRGGVVGSNLPGLSAALVSVTPGDTLILATDGIRSGFWDHLSVGEATQHLANQILSDYGKGTDDALVLVARCVGAPS